MQSKSKIFCVYLLIFSYIPLSAQIHISVPLENQVYYILEQAEMKGLCAPMSGIKPYTRSVVISAIKEILFSDSADKLKSVEREILEQYLNNFSKPKTGIDWQRGAYYGETTLGKSDALLSINMGVIADIEGSSGTYSSGDYYLGTEVWMGAYVNGDLGNNVSYDFSAEGGLIRAPRNKHPGRYNTYYEGFVDEFEENSEFENKKIITYSEPLTHFPYTYKKRWDSSVFFLSISELSDLAGFEAWPNGISGGYNLMSELTGSFFENKLIMRLGRLSHEWGSTSFGSSLAFNQMARPFLGVEAEFNPFSWFSIATLTGVLEYYNAEGIYESPKTSQNAFSITMLQFKYKNYLFLDFVDAAVWPKRFELGYMAPITNNFFYQNNSGKFDNMALTVSLKAQYPGLGNVWVSLFVDEMQLTSEMFELDRTMIAGQAGMSFPLPFLSFSSIKLSYTMINPYCYTHHRNYVPWYGDLRMEKAYTNNGVSLGYYLPPNSDEILVRFSTMPAKNINTHLQYQLIRHGADFGSSAVDGSNLLSELDPYDRNTNDVLKRFFLQDGAYQWMHIIKTGAEWKLPKTPVTLYGEAGTVISYFTNIDDGKANDGSPHDYSIIDTPEYPKSNGFIVTLGFRVFSR
ncbi:MAG: hypothetical protein LBH44_09440 [Treponema sp.]|nr:hypothetical protein [Treponema sp.]